MKGARPLRALMLCFALAACTQSSTTTMLPPAPSLVRSGSQPTQKAEVIFRIVIPRGRSDRAHYVSPATRSIAITFTPRHKGKARHFYENLTPATNKHCKGNVCALKFLLKPGKYAVSIVTYDGLLAGGAPSGHRLSANHLPFVVKSAKLNTIRTTLGGIPASLAFVPADPTAFSAGYAAGTLSVSKCLPPQSVSIYGMDADSNIILGAGAPRVSLASDDPADLAVTSPSPSSPNAFVLTRPRIPEPFQPLNLTLTAQPTAGTGASAASKILKVYFNDDTCGVITEYTLPTAASAPVDISIGFDFNLWFAESGSSQIGRITTNGVISEFPLPTAAASPRGIAYGNDGRLWFTESGASKIGAATLSGTITEYSTGITAGSKPWGITEGPDLALWFTEFSGNRIGRIDTLGAVTEYNVPTASSAPFAIVQVSTSDYGGISAMWFTECQGNKIARITTAGSINEMVTLSPGTAPQGIAVGLDHKLWFASRGTAKIAAFEFGGLIDERTIPGGAPHKLTIGYNDDFWVTDPGLNAIVHVPLNSSSVTIVPIPTANASPDGITRGADGNIWFTEKNGNKIGRLQ